jgi:hypothetical protein
MKIADILDLTRVHRDYVGEVRFPEFDPNDWELFFEETHEGLDSISSLPVRFTYETYRRR